MKNVRKIEEWILLVTISSLALATLTLGWYFYQDSYQRILKAFDLQNMAISVTAASFIDGGLHNQLAQPYRLDSIAWDAGQKRFTVTDEQGKFFVVDMVSKLGGVDPAEGGFGQPVSSHAWLGETAYGLGTDGKTLLTWNAREGVKKQFLPVAATVLGTWQEGLLVAGDHFHHWDPVKKQWRMLGTVPEPLAALQSGPEFLLGLKNRGEDGYELLQIDPETGTAHPWLPLVPEAADDDASIKVPGLGFAWGDNQLWVLTPEHLVDLAPVDKAGQAAEKREDWASLQALGSSMARGFRSQNDPIFQRYVPAMREIKKKAEITYLYTYIYSGLAKGTTELTYVLDSTTERENYSNIGALDEYPEDEMREIALVLENIRPRVGPLRRYEPWGLLKQGAAPILDRSGRAVAILGVDVDANVIHKKTRLALLQVLILGGVMMILGGFVALKLAREISRPLYYLKNTALRVAAGNFTDRTRLGGAMEMQKLSDSFTGVTQNLEERMRELGAESVRVEAQRVQAVLERRFLTASGAPPEWHEYYAEVGDFADSGSCHVPGRSLSWRRRKSMRRLDATRQIAMYRRISLALLQRHADPKELVVNAARLIEADIVFYEWETRRILTCSQGKVEEIKLPPEEGLVVNDLENGWGCHLEIKPVLSVVGLAREKA